MPFSIYTHPFPFIAWVRAQFGQSSWPSKAAPVYPGPLADSSSQRWPLHRELQEPPGCAQSGHPTKLVLAQHAPGTPQPMHAPAPAILPKQPLCGVLQNHLPAHPSSSHPTKAAPTQQIPAYDGSSHPVKVALAWHTAKHHSPHPPQPQWSHQGSPGMTCFRTSQPVPKLAILPRQLRDPP